MPRSALARREERFRPSLSSRLKQSAEDRKKRGERKLAKREQDQKRFIKGMDSALTNFIGTPLNSVTINSINNTINLYTINNIGLLGGDQGAAALNKYHQQIWATWTNAATTSVQVNFWHNWCEESHITRASSDYRVFRAWTEVHELEMAIHARDRRYNPIEVIESEAEKRARLAREEQYRRDRAEQDRRFAEEAAKRKKAEETAMELLMGFLSKEQREMLKKLNYFLVTAKSGRIYRIEQGSHGNVKVVDKNNRMLEKLCIQPTGVPYGDSMLMQKMMIETAEDVFRKHANITLPDGKLIFGDSSLLTGEKLAQVIPIRKAA